MLVAHNTQGNIVSPGDAVCNFRGEAYTFLAATQETSPGKSGKIVVRNTNDFEYEAYATAFDLIVTNEERSS